METLHQQRKYGSKDREWCSEKSLTKTPGFCGHVVANHYGYTLLVHCNTLMNVIVVSHFLLHGRNSLTCSLVFRIREDLLSDLPVVKVMQFCTVDSLTCWHGSLGILKMKVQKPQKCFL